MLSVIIPALNEDAVLGALLDDLHGQRGVELDVLVADGGSRDATPRLARRAGATLVASEPGRGRQMNRARTRARGAWLLFLHADSRLRAPRLLADALAALDAAGPSTAGHFGLHFEAPADTRHRRLYRHLERKSRSNRPQTINGDQGLMLEAAFFDRLGGFDERLPFLEDQAISERIVATGRWRLLPGTLATSARRFEEEGPAQRYLLMMLIMCARQAGADEFFERAAALYPQQSQTRRLRLRPYYELLLELAERHPAFWPAMADYARENLWQLGFALDTLLGRDLVTPGMDRLAAALPPAAFRRLAAPLLRWLCRGPLRQALVRL